MVKKKNFDMYESGLKDVELRDIKPQWKNTRIGGIATIMCGRRVLRKKMRNIHRGNFGSIVCEIGGWKRMFPEAETLLEVLREKRQIYPDSKEFMAFELIRNTRIMRGNFLSEFYRLTLLTIISFLYHQLYPKPGVRSYESLVHNDHPVNISVFVGWMGILSNQPHCAHLSVEPFHCMIP